MGVTGVGLVAGSQSVQNADAASGPTANIDANLPATEGESVTFDGSGSTGDIDTYEWYYDRAEDTSPG
jgi:hypothetical protein